MLSQFIFLLTVNLFFTSALAAKDHRLTIVAAGKTKTFLRSQLLQRSDLETLVIADDPAYPGRVMRYSAIKVTRLFGRLKIDDDAVIQFKTRDGFSAVLSNQRLLNRSPAAAIAYLAIESPTKKWPVLKSGKHSAGPFYLVWKNPKKSHISHEEWPFMIAAFEVKGSLESTYPQIFPKPRRPQNHPVTRGFQLFVKNCFGCHPINGGGAAQIGPDLNLPMNPTQYFRESALKKLIRNPQQVRRWANSRMTGFDRSILNDDQLNAIISYLKAMSRKP